MIGVNGFDQFVNQLESDPLSFITLLWRSSSTLDNTNVYCCCLQEVLLFPAMKPHEDVVEPPVRVADDVAS
jgi:hypothetical protein